MVLKSMCNIKQLIPNNSKNSLMVREMVSLFDLGNLSSKYLEIVIKVKKCQKKKRCGEEC